MNWLGMNRSHHVLILIFCIAVFPGGCDTPPTLEVASDGQSITFVSIEAVRESLEPYEAQCFEPAMGIIGGYSAGPQWEGVGWEEISTLWVQRVNERYRSAHQTYSLTDEVAFEEALVVAQRRLSNIAIGEFRLGTPPRAFMGEYVLYATITNNSDIPIFGVSLDLEGPDERSPFRSRGTNRQRERFDDPINPSETRSILLGGMLAEWVNGGRPIQRNSLLERLEVEPQVPIEGTVLDFSTAYAPPPSWSGDVEVARSRLASVRRHNADVAFMLRRAEELMQQAQGCRLQGLEHQ